MQIPEQATRTVDAVTDAITVLMSDIATGVNGKPEQFRTDDGPYSQAVETELNGVRIRVTIEPVLTATVPEIGSTLALDVSDGPVGKITHVNPAVGPESAEVRVRWADRSRRPSWVQARRLVEPAWDS